MPFVAGETIGPYKLMEQLGQGGMATVYKAYHAALDRFVAIKALHPAFMEDANFLARFQREARVVARLEHPNIVPVYDFAEYEGRPYLVMKYIEGETLKSVLQQAVYGHKAIEADEFARIVEAVGAGLSYAHRQGILHRDIKPSNVLITPSGHIYLADFGLARIAASGGSTLSSDMLVGTPQYISPEQAQSQSDLDVRSDIYSFGVMLYEMVVGRVPFQGDTPFAIIHDHIYTPLPLPRTINPLVPESVEKVLIKALAKNRDERYSSVDEMVAAFNEALRSSFPPSVTVLAEPRVLPPAEITATPGLADSSPVNNTSQSDEAVVPRDSTAAAPVMIDLTGAPSYTPPDLDFAPAGLPPAITAREESISASRPVETAKKKKRLSGWVIAGLVGVGLALCAGVWLVNRNLNQLASGVLKTAAADATQTMMISPTSPVLTQLAADASNAIPTSVPPDAWKTAMDALALWQNHNYLLADTMFTRSIRQAGDSSAFFNLAGEKLAASAAWTPAALMYVNLSRVEGTSLTAEQYDRLRQALFSAAKEPQAKALFSKNQTQPLYLIDQARFILYQGDLNKAKNLLDGVLASPGDLGKFPEARLVQAETLIKDGNKDQAAKVVNDLLNQPVLPAWIMASARELLTQASQPN